MLRSQISRALPGPRFSQRETILKARMSGFVLTTCLENIMSDRVYKKTEVVGSSKESIEDAIRTAIRRTAKTLHHVEWFEVQEVRGDVVDGEVAHFQVSMKVGFRLD